MALSCVLVSLRTWIQVRVTSRMYINDYLIIIALILHIATTAIIQAARPYTYELLEATAAAIQGKQPDMEYYLVRMPMFLRYQLALSIMFWSTLWAVKFALLSFFWRLFDSVKTHARIFWWFMVAVTASTLTVSVFLQLFACGTPANFTTAGTLPFDSALSRFKWLICAGVCFRGLYQTSSTLQVLGSTHFPF